MKKTQSSQIDKQQTIISMFDAIAPTYDLTNRVMSFGVDKRWRRIACDVALATYDRPSADILDVACGTGDMLLYWKKRAEKRDVAVDSYLGVDPSREMLERARQRVLFAEFVQGKAQQLTVADASRDIISISYGIRNVVDRGEAFAEFYRALRPGGLAVIVEFTRRPKAGVVSRFVDFYMHHIIPAIGGMLSRNRAAYQYLPDSIDEFLTKAKLEEELTEAGFTLAHSKSYSFGVSSLLIAKKPHGR